MNVPGLRYIPNFVSKQLCKELEVTSFRLLREIRNDSQHRSKVSGRTYLSKQHNLKTEESFKKVTLNDEDGTRTGQYFDKYGDHGHELIYFIGNNNIPNFARSSLLCKLSNMDEIQAIIPKKKTSGDLQWNFTFNAYSSQPTANLTAGFPFHVDVHSNGLITTIFTFLDSATFEIRKRVDNSRIQQIILTPGSAVVLSGESRYDWEHCVLPRETKEKSKEVINEANDYRVAGVKRISMVLGCSP